MTTAQPAVPAYLVVAQLHQDVTRCRIFEKHHILDDVLVLEHGMDSNLARKLQQQIKRQDLSITHPGDQADDFKWDGQAYLVLRAPLLQRRFRNHLRGIDLLRVLLNHSVHLGKASLENRGLTLVIAASSGWTHSYLAEEVRLLESLNDPNLPCLGISFPPFDQLAHAGWPVRIDGSMSVHLQNGSHYDGMGKDEGGGTSSQPYRQCRPFEALYAWLRGWLTRTGS